MRVRVHLYDMHMLMHMLMCTEATGRGCPVKRRTVGLRARAR